MSTWSSTITTLSSSCLSIVYHCPYQFKIQTQRTWKGPESLINVPYSCMLPVSATHQSSLHYTHISPFIGYWYLSAHLMTTFVLAETEVGLDQTSLCSCFVTIAGASFSKKKNIFAVVYCMDCCLFSIVLSWEVHVNHQEVSWLTDNVQEDCIVQVS